MHETKFYGVEFSPYRTMLLLEKFQIMEYFGFQIFWLWMFNLLFPFPYMPSLSAPTLDICSSCSFHFSCSLCTLCHAVPPIQNVLTIHISTLLVPAQPAELSSSGGGRSILQDGSVSALTA
jgi:hypothetical protein